MPRIISSEYSSISVTSNNIKNTGAPKIRLADAEIVDFLPKTQSVGRPIKITGTNFINNPDSIQVFIDGRECTITTSRGIYLMVTIPNQEETFFSSRSVSVRVIARNVVHEFESHLTLTSSWFRLPDAPENFGLGNNYANMKSFVVGDKAYIGLENSQKLWEFNPSDNSWSAMQDFPGVSRELGTGFVLNSKIYFGTGRAGNNYLNDWWEFDPALNTWSQKRYIPDVGRYGAPAFVLEARGYVGVGYYPDLDIFGEIAQDYWMYSSEQDSWEPLVTETLHTRLYDGIAESTSEYAIVGLGRGIYSHNDYSTIYKYETETNTHLQLANFGYSDRFNNSLSFIFNDEVYVKGSFTHNLYKYDNSANRWISVPCSVSSNVENGIGFSIGGKAYMGLGGSNSMWEYAP